MHLTKSSLQIALTCLIFFIISVSLFSLIPAPHPLDSLRKKTQPYLLPIDHPLKSRLDTLFLDGTVLDSLENMREAGFILLKTKSELDVAIHPDIPGYVIKFYLNSHNNAPRFNKLGLKDSFISELRLWTLRVKGGERVRTTIDFYQYHHLLKVANMWIFPLPNGNTSQQPFPKLFVFIEEDMKIVNNEENIRCYKEKITLEQLIAFYTVLKEGGLYDSIYIDNNPFSTDGRIAFVDTEEYDRKPVLFEKLTPYFSAEMQVYWNKLIAQDKITD